MKSEPLRLIKKPSPFSGRQHGACLQFVKPLSCVLLLSLFCLGSSACGLVQRRAIERAHLAIQIGEYDIALKQISVAEKFEGSADKQNAERKYLRAKSYEGLGRIAEAIHQYESISAAFPTSPYAYLADIKLDYLRGSGENSDRPRPEEPISEAYGAASTSEANTDGSAFKNYLEEVKKKIDSRWIYPCLKSLISAECDFKTAELIVELNVHRSGNISSTKVLKRSGIDLYDFSAIEAIILAAPFAAIPPNLFTGKDVARLLIHMQYYDNRK